MDALYAFMRHTDDLADEPAPADVRREAIAAWQEAVEGALRGQGAGASKQGSGVRDQRSGEAAGGQWPVVSESNVKSQNPKIPKSPISLPSPLSSLPFSILPALADTVEKYRIPQKYLMAVIEGVAMDLEPRPFETFRALETYCEHVASAVGLACIHIWGFHGPEALEPARQVGVALQLTNILRDLKEDTEQGRVYLPLDDLRACGYSVEDLQRGVINESFFRLMKMEIEQAEQFYCEGNALFPLLESDGRRIFGLMTDTYHSLLERMKQQPEAVFQRRIRLGTLAKIMKFARWAFLPSRMNRPA